MGNKMESTALDMNLYSTDFTDEYKRLTVYVEPVPKARPRHTKTGRTYTPKKTVDYENLIAKCWNMGMSDSTLKMELKFYMPIPKSMRKKDRELALSGKIAPNKKPDIDNLIKSVLDALNEVAYFDDKQVTSLVAEKLYADTPRVEIKITEIEKRANERIHFRK